jgi:uncharacterized protein YndB with AHSA1/START domain
MGLVEYSVWINATPERVWAVYVDPTRIPDWQTGRPSVVSVRGQPGVPGSSYVSKRGPLAATTTVVAADAPHRLTTRIDAYLDLTLEVTSRLVEKAGGVDLRIRATTHWRRRWGPIARLVETAILNPREAKKELSSLKALLERPAS